MSPFISNLFRAIEDQKFPEIINWSDSGGNYFVIFSMDLFKMHVLPQYFTTTSYSTFVRQVSQLLLVSLDLFKIFWYSVKNLPINCIEVVLKQRI